MMPNHMRSLEEAASERVLLMDGAMGTMLSQRWTQELIRPSASVTKGLPCLEMLNLTRPDIVIDVHRQYLEAGADILTTNSFMAQRHLAYSPDMARLCPEMALQSARLARQAIQMFGQTGGERYVVGTMGPVDRRQVRRNCVCALNEAEMLQSIRDSYFETSVALLEGGVDALLLETAYDLTVMECALDACLLAKKQCGIQVPMMLSMTLNGTSGHLLSGASLQQAMLLLQSWDLFAVGLNCGCGLEALLLWVEWLSRHVDSAVFVSPSAGLPDADGRYPESEHTMATALCRLARQGLVNMVGGCCGTSPALIRWCKEGLLDSVPRPF